MADPIDIANLTARLSAAYPNWNISPLTNEMYYEDLKDIPAEELMLASKYCRTDTTRDQRFAPSAGEIRKAAAEIRRKAQGVPSALDAWNEVCNADYRHISTTSPMYSGGVKYTEDPNPHKWSHPLVEKIARQFGWPDFPKFENESVDRAHFFKQYESASQDKTSEMMELPEVTRYIESGGAIKKLADGMKK